MLLASLDSGLLAAAPQAISVDFDATFLVQLVLFTGLTLVLKPLLFDPMLKLFEERERRIDGAKLQARKIDEKSATALAKYETEMAQRTDVRERRAREDPRRGSQARTGDPRGGPRLDAEDDRRWQARRLCRGGARARQAQERGREPRARRGRPRPRKRGPAMRRSTVVRRIALAAMALVTAWSVWAWAQPARPSPAAAVAEGARGHAGRPAGGRREPRARRP